MKHFLSLLLVLLGGALTASAENWSSWRGPEQTGVSRDTGLPDTFAVGKNAKNVLWKAPYGGITTPVVQNGRVYFINKVGEEQSQQERVMCVDADTGKFLWEHKFNVFLTGIVADRLGWTQMVGDAETGYVYAHGTQGFLFCFDKDGKIVWQHSLSEEYGRISGYGGRLTSPVLFEDLLILPMVLPLKRSPSAIQRVRRCCIVSPSRLPLGNSRRWLVPAVLESRRCSHWLLVSMIQQVDTSIWMEWI